MVAKIDFETRVIARAPDECWGWDGPHTEDGYARHSSRGAHCISYERRWGPVPDGLEVDHVCRNRGCVNPDHLEAVTHAENMRRAAEAQTHCTHGHLYDEQNTYRDARGYRFCRTCNRAAAAAYRRRRML